MIFNIPQPAKCITVAAAGTNLDSYTEEGWYYFSSGNAPSNPPIGVSGFLHVVNASNTAYIKQFWYRLGTIDSTDHQTFVRTHFGAGWSAWTQYVTEKEAVSMTKLWENASPTSSFGEQTIIIDTSQYQFVIIFCRTGTDNPNEASVILYTGSIGILHVRHLSSGTVMGRIAEVYSADGVRFGGGYYGTTADNNRCIPIKIYGIKGVS